ncbi:MAG: glutathione peroxidase [Myxococcota bacterium]|jgi:glutathione peroxidase|nr:glutathione peroxidase [Myxococcota bacterium]
MSLYQLEVRSLEGQPVPLSTFQGRVTLLVNVASACGFTPQYEGLERLHQKYASRGFSVLGFPSNDFGKQEPGTPEQIRDFCTTKFHVTFPMFEKVQTKAGAGQSPVYAAIAKSAVELPKWNFGKYLLDRNGNVIRSFASDVKPEDPELVRAIEHALGPS